MNQLIGELTSTGDEPTDRRIDSSINRRLFKTTTILEEYNYSRGLTLQSLPTCFRNLSDATSRLMCDSHDSISVSVKFRALSATCGLFDLKHLRVRLITSYTLKQKQRSTGNGRQATNPRISRREVTPDAR